MYLLNVPIEKSEFSQDEISYLIELSKRFVKEELIIYYQALRQMLEQMRFSPYPKYDFEVGLLKVIYLKDFLEGSEVLQKSQKQHEVKKEDLKNIKNNEEKEEQNLDNKKDILKILLKSLKSASKLEAYLKDASLILTDKVLKIVFPASKKFFYDYFNDNETDRKEIEKAVKTIYGKDFGISFLLQQDSLEDKNNFVAKESVYEREPIKKILNAFKGSKILGVKQVELSKEEENILEQNFEIEEREVIDE
jgi:DNA polymerase III gamma/tau subunit